MFVLGMDIGYSNLKLVFGDRESPETRTQCVLPAGAAPLDRVHKTVMGEIPADVMQVLVDDELWATAVSQNRLSHTVRQLHKDYTSSKPYRALFHTALHHVGKC